MQFRVQGSEKSVKMKRPKCNNISHSFWPVQEATMTMRIAICSWFRCPQVPCVRLSALAAGAALVVRVVAKMFRKKLPRLNRARELVSFMFIHLDDLRENRIRIFDSGPTTAEVSHPITRNYSEAAGQSKALCPSFKRVRGVDTFICAMLLNENPFNCSHSVGSFR